MDILAREKLRKIVSGCIQGDISDFPIVLLLLTNPGEPQNLTPLRQKIRMSELFEGEFPDIPIFRFFIDGLVAHIGRKPLDRKLTGVWGNRVLGASRDLLLIGRKYDGSFQEQNLNQNQFELEKYWPDEADRIYGALNKNG